MLPAPLWQLSLPLSQNKKKRTHMVAWCQQTLVPPRPWAQPAYIRMNWQSESRESTPKCSSWKKVGQLFCLAVSLQFCKNEACYLWKQACFAICLLQISKLQNVFHSTTSIHFTPSYSSSPAFPWHFSMIRFNISFVSLIYTLCFIFSNLRLRNFMF